MLKGTVNGILAGICIAIGGTVFLSCDNRYIGSLLFAVALLTICALGFSLYTGKIGFIIDSHKKDDISVLLTGLLGNAIATIAFGYLIALALPAVGEAANAVCTARLTQTWYSTFIRAVMCGMLMYIACAIYKEKNTMSGIFFAIPVFILSGFEHSIADMFYFAASGIASLKALGYIGIVIAGNTVGGWVFPVGRKLMAKLDGRSN